MSPAPRRTLPGGYLLLFVVLGLVVGFLVSLLTRHISNPVHQVAIALPLGAAAAIALLALSRRRR